MKKVLFTLYKDKCHSLYKNFIFNPPEGYQYFTLDDFTDKFIFQESTNILVEIYNKIRRNFFIIRIAQKNDIDIIYCTSGILLFNSPIPWVVDFESVTSFIIHKLKYWRLVKYLIPQLLNQRNLKALIPWTEAAADSLLHNIRDKDCRIKNKMIPVRLCLNYINDKNHKNPDGHPFTVLFVTTVNNHGDQEFYVKGGHILAKVFQKLKDEIPVTFILRARIPNEYGFLKKEAQIKIYEDRLLDDEFEKIFLESDVFLFPCYQSPGLVFLDAMNYKLPIITTNIFSNSEMVIPNFNGFLINFSSSSTVNYLETEFGIKGIQTGKKSREDIIPDSLVNEFCQKIMVLYRDEDQRKTMMENSKKLLMEKFTIDSRNKQLAFVYNKILDNTSNLS